MGERKRWLYATLTAGTLALGGTAVAAPAASAAGFGCEAQSLGLALGGADLTGGALTAGSTGTCADDAAGLDLSVLAPLGVDADALTATTDLSPDGGPAAEQTATAASRAADVDVSVAGLAELLHVDATTAQATATCPDPGAAPQLSSTSRVEGLRVLGQAIPDLDPTATRVVELTQGLLPGQVARVEVNTEATEGGVLVRRALRVRVLNALPGLPPVADVTVGRAAVAPGDVDCAQVSPEVVVDRAGVNRTVAAHAVLAPGRSVASASFRVRPVGSTDAPTTIPARIDGTTLTADLPRDAFGPGDYEVVADVVDDAGRTGSGTGTQAVATPSIGAPAASGRVVSVAVTPAPGVDVVSCEVAVGPVGATPTAIGGTFDATAGTCSARVPDSVPAGEATLRVTATDRNGDTGTGTATGRLGELPPASADPRVTVLETGVNRQVAADVEVADGRTVAGCAVQATPAGGSPVAVEATYDAQAGVCRATLPASGFGAGDVAVTVTATDSSGATGSGSGSVAVVVPTIGTPVIDGTEIRVPVTPPPGVAITGCDYALAPVAGGSPIDVDATYDPRTGQCVGSAAPGTSGQFTLTTTATDADGGQGSAQTPVRVGGPNAGPTGPTTPTTPNGTGSGGGTGPGSGGGSGSANSTSAASTGGGTRPNFQTATQGELLTGCGTNRLLLTQVAQVGRQVRIAGAADAALIGKRVDVRLMKPAGTVATAVIGRDGTFTARAALPTKSLRNARTTRYQAAIGDVVSKRLKLQRRLTTTALGPKGGEVLIRGAASAPRARARQVVTVQQLVACGSYKTVGRTMLTARGRFEARIAKPASATAAVYRAVTKVAKRAGGKPVIRTYTLPAGVTLR